MTTNKGNKGKEIYVKLIYKAILRDTSSDFLDLEREITKSQALIDLFDQPDRVDDGPTFSEEELSIDVGSDESS
ncbi:hypothetical protein HAX54_008543, partial [Datura stramonium]|nr:hypothetical protein [Datura stramonium]